MIQNLSLMSADAITYEDRKSMADFCLHADKFTYSKHVRKFEQSWSEWQGCKYSVFVNSGSSANLILVNAMKILHGIGVWICQSSTWATNVCPVIQLGMPLQLCDINLSNFAPDIDNLESLIMKVNPKFLFLTHLLGFPAISKRILNLCDDNNICLIEDCCESHGATFKDKKVGNFGEGSTFSFFYGHHMTTIEGGMICTSNDDIYHLCLLLRSHGLLRELPDGIRKDYEIEGIDPEFTFLEKGFNLRNTEMHAVLGSMQLARLDDVIYHRNRNLKCFLDNLDASKYKTDYNVRGVSSFCLPLYCYISVEKVREFLVENNVEFRPVISGNLFRHPMMSDVNCLVCEKNAELIHQNALYIGNHQGLFCDQILKLCSGLNGI